MRSFKKELKKLYPKHFVTELKYANDSNSLRYIIKDNFENIIEEFDIIFSESIYLYFIESSQTNKKYNKDLLNHLIVYIKDGIINNSYDNSFEILKN